uniref:Putative ovule protein n=2 Tax=Solanum chacoense TaxID=4108 RepID=A0A0V0H806_SOLCH
MCSDEVHPIFIFIFFVYLKGLLIFLVEITGKAEMGNHPSQKIPISPMPHSLSTRNGFSDLRMDSPFKTTKWDIKGSDFAVFLNKAKEKSDSAMAADTSLLFKAITRSPCQDTGRIFSMP